VSEAVPEVPLWKKPETVLLAKEIGKHLLIAAVLLYVVLGVLKPIFKVLMRRPDPAVLPEAAVQGKQAEALRQQINLSYEQQLQEARQLAQQEPKLVANVVKDWMAGNEQ